MAHEMLHAALRHGTRRQGRDPYIWNVACDYVINGWLVEMGVGDDARSRPAATTRRSRACPPRPSTTASSTDLRRLPEARHVARARRSATS